VSLSGQTFPFETRKLALQENLPNLRLGAVRDYRAVQFRTRKQIGDEIMLGLIAAVLIICWLLGLFAFHVSTGLFHILLVVGLILLVLHFVSGRRVSV
jgi:predicted ferric reductase